jgi:hypothetical protein
MTEDVPCDFCQVSHKKSIPPPDRTPNSEKHTGLDVNQREKLRAHDEHARYREHLEAVRGTCLLCRARNKPRDHRFSECYQRHRLFEQRNKTRRRHEAEGQTWFKPFTACFWCCNPQSVCQRAENGDEKRNKDGSDRDVVLPSWRASIGSTFTDPALRALNASNVTHARGDGLAV